MQYKGSATLPEEGTRHLALYQTSADVGKCQITTTMPPQNSTINRHLPLITHRIEFFSSNSHSAPPLITPRIDFGARWAPERNRPDSSLSSDIDVEMDDAASDAASDISVASTDNKSSSDSEQDEAKDKKGKKIPKPSGQPGRPHSGGYSMETELRGWSPKMFADVNVRASSTSMSY